MITRQQVSASSRRVAVGVALTFAITACGGSNSNSASSGGGDATAASWCDFADDAEVLDTIFDTLGEDPGEVETALKQVESIMGSMTDRAPAEIADDAKIVADSTQLLIDAFAAADYNLLNADLSFMSDTELEARLDAAGDRIDAYTERECGRAFGETDSDTDSDDSTTEDSTVDDADDDGFDPAGGTLREQLIEQFTSIGLTADEAGCIADNLDFGDPAVQSGDIGAMLGVYEDCGIGLDRLAEIGG